MEVDKKKPKLFVGFCRLALLDSDGLCKRVNGCNLEAAVRQHRNDHGDLILVSEFPRVDSIHFLRLGFSEDEHLTGVWSIGSAKKADEQLNPNRTICVLESVNTKTALNELSVKVEKGEAPRLRCSAILPFIDKPYDRAVTVNIDTKEHKFMTKIVRVEVVIPEEYYKEWETYYEAIKEFEEKEDKNCDKEKSDKNKKNEE